jgi:hypothetical protein
MLSAMGIFNRLFRRQARKVVAEGETETQGWGVYVAVRDGHQATILVDLDFPDNDPGPELPLWLEISLALRTCDVNGWPDPAEMDGLRPLESRLEEAMHAEGAVHVGAGNWNSRRRWFFYAPEGDYKSVVQKVLSERRADSPSMTVSRDPDRKLYRKLLYPDREAMRYIKDNRVLTALAEHGDSAETPRKIEHFAYFSTRRAAEQYATWVRENGFDVEELLLPSSATDRHGVRFSHIGAAVPLAITEKTSLAEAGAEQLGGEYDGWETMIVRGS